MLSNMALWPGVRPETAESLGKFGGYDHFDGVHRSGLGMPECPIGV